MSGAMQPISRLIACWVFFSAVFCMGCSPKIANRVWNEDGIVKGKIEVVRMPDGSLYRYYDNEGLIRRIEKRDKNNCLKSDYLVKCFEYPKKDMAVLSYFNSSNIPVTGPEGFHKQIIAADSALYCRTYEYFDVDGQAVHHINGYAKAQYYMKPGSHYPVKVIFFDKAGNAALASYNEVSGVHYVVFTVLKGEGLMLFGAFYDSNGRIIARKRISGSTAWSSESTTYYNRYRY